MTGTPEPAELAAAQIWRRAIGDRGAPVGVDTAADSLWASLRIGLGRWVGVDGYRVLLARALGEALVDHPALAGLSCLGDDEAPVSKAVEVHGPGAVANGMVALLTGMIELLGRIMGEEMALHLVEQAGVARTRNGVRLPPMEDSHG